MNDFNLEKIRKNGYQVLKFPLSLKNIILNSVKNKLSINLQINRTYNKLSIDKICNEINKYDYDKLQVILKKQNRIIDQDVTKLIELYAGNIFKDTDIKYTDISCLSEFEQHNYSKEHIPDFFFRYVKPGLSYNALPHADYIFWETTQGTIYYPFSKREYDERWKFWIPLSGVDNTNSLCVIPKSHTENIPYNSSKQWIIDENDSKTKLVKPCVDLEWFTKNKERLISPIKSKNSVIIFHDRLVHQGMNHASLTRLSAEFTLLVKYL